MIDHATDLPAQVCRVLWRSVDSVEKLEVLRFGAHADAAWTTHLAAAALDLPEEDVAFAAACLCQADLLHRDGYVHGGTPATGAAGEVVDSLYQLCAFDAQKVLDVIQAFGPEVALAGDLDAERHAWQDAPAPGHRHL